MIDDSTANPPAPANPKPGKPKKGMETYAQGAQTDPSNTANVNKLPDWIRHCSECGKFMSADGSCQNCLKTANDIPDHTIEVKSEERKQTKLIFKPFGVKQEPIKIEPDVYAEEEVEENKDEPTTYGGSIEEPQFKFFEAADGRQMIWINGEWIMGKMLDVDGGAGPAKQ